MSELIFAIWFFLPAGAANVMPIFSSKIPGIKNWDTPIDLNKKWRGKRITGDHKTIRGFVVGTFVGTLVFWLQTALYENHHWAREAAQHLNYSELTLWLGFLLAFGALFGDLLKSFFKRQFNVRSGNSWFPFDQLDYIFGALILSTLVVTLDLIDYLVIAGVWFLTHLVSSLIGYKIGVKEHPI